MNKQYKNTPNNRKLGRVGKPYGWKRSQNVRKNTKTATKPKTKTKTATKPKTKTKTKTATKPKTKTVTKTRTVTKKTRTKKNAKKNEQLWKVVSTKSKGTTCRLSAGAYYRKFSDGTIGDICDIRNDGDLRCLMERKNGVVYWAKKSKSGEGQEKCGDDVWRNNCQVNEARDYCANDK